VELTVTPAPQAVFPFGEQDTLVINNRGPWTIYVDSDSSINAHSHPIPPTGVMVWDAERPLWMMCDPSAGAVGGGSSVTITRNSSPSQFTNSTENVLISAQAATGPGVAWQSSDDIFGSFGDVKTASIIECSAYNSLTLMFKVPDANIIQQAAITSNNMHIVQMYWYDVNGLMVAHDNFYVPFQWSIGSPTNTPLGWGARLVVPVRGAYFAMYFTTEITIQTQLRVIGTTRILDYGIYPGITRSFPNIVNCLSYAVDQRTDGFALELFAPFTAGTFARVWLPAVNKNLRVSWVIQGATNASAIYLTDGANTAAASVIISTPLAANVSTGFGTFTMGHIDYNLAQWVFPCLWFVYGSGITAVRLMFQWT
jgi:hypothetical protein